MRSSRKNLLGAAAVAAALAIPAQAGAVERVRAVFFQEFDAETYAIDQGEITTFLNSDPFLAHGIVSDATGPGGEPLFSAPVVKTGQKRLVRGAPYLPENTYAFSCPIHPSMTGELEVGPAGAPLPPDSQAPKAGLAIRASRTRALTHARRVKIRVATGEAVEVLLTARMQGITLGSRRALLTTPGKRVFLLGVAKRPAKRLRRALATAYRERGRRRLPLKLTAHLTDAAGNIRKRTISKRLLIAPRPSGRNQPSS